MRWLITGGCGFIGTNIIRRLLAESPETNIRVLDDLSVGTREDLGEIADFVEIEQGDAAPDWTGVQLLVGDIRDKDAALAAAGGVDCLVHLAANTGVGPSVEDPRADMEANVIGTFNLLEASRRNGVKSFIFASSGAPVGETTPPIHEEIAPHPVSPYGASKLAGEGYCSAYYRSYGLRTVVLRFGNVYGPGSKKKSSVVAKFIKQAAAGEVCRIYGDGSQTRDFIYIDDLVEAVILSSQYRQGGDIFQIATNKEHTVNEVADIIKKLLLEYGIDMKLVHTEPRVGDVMRNYSDTSKAGKILGWSPKQDLESGIRKTIEYFFWNP